MSEKSTEEYTEKMRERYARMIGRRARSKMLDEFMTIDRLLEDFKVQPRWIMGWKLGGMKTARR